MSQYLRIQHGEYVVELLPEGTVLPSGADWVALTRAPEGLTVVRPARPDDPADSRWIAFYSGQATHDLDVPGMLAALVNPLAEAAVPVFVASTYHADLVFVQAWRRDEAAGILRRAGHVIEDAAEAPA